MADTLIFRGVTIRYVDLRRDEAGTFNRIHMSADLSGPLREAMEWDQIPQSIAGPVKLVGEIAAKSFKLTPNDKELKKHGIELSCNQVIDFKAAPRKNDEGEIVGHQLRFVLVTADTTAEAAIGHFLRTVGTTVAQLSVAYSVQGSLFGNSEAKQSAEASEAGDDETDADETEPEPEVGGTLASVSSMKRKQQPTNGGVRVV